MLEDVEKELDRERQKRLWFEIDLYSFFRRVKKFYKKWRLRLL